MSISRNLSELPMTFNYTVVFPFEEAFDPDQKRELMVQNRRKAFYFSGIYIVLIFGLQAYMKVRPRLELRRTIAVWNICLAVFNIIGLCRTLPELSHALSKFGFTHSVCDPNFIAQDRVTAFWAWQMTISKLLEFGDTLFVILRKHQLTYLHWHHHVLALLYTWYSYSEHAAPFRWFMIMNFFVHSLMYTYYALSVMRIKLPRPFAISITSLQIMQMVIGLYVAYHGYVVRHKGQFCHVSEHIAIYGVLLYLDFLILFSRFFYLTYLTPKAKLKKLN